MKSAIDWADQKHAWMLQTGSSTSRQAGTIEHTPEAVAVWATALRSRFDYHPIAVAVEQSRGPLVLMLTKYKHLVIFPIHPTTLANYRQSFRPSGAKDEWFDEIGSNIAAEFLERWPSLDKLQRARPATNDAAVITACAVAVVEWAGLLKQLLRTIEGYDKKIDALAREHPDYALIKSLPGAGPCSLHGLSPHWGVSETDTNRLTNSNAIAG